MEELESTPGLCKQGVAGSIPATSTKRFHCTRFIEFAFNLFSPMHASLRNLMARA